MTVLMSLPRAGVVSLAVFDVSGRRVRQLRSGVVEAGVHRVAWDGRSESGSPAAPGLYLVGLQVDGERRTKRVTLLP
jgi:flagellar hook assembly protein FlgD